MIQLNYNKLAIISSCGGHLTEVRALRAVYSAYDHFYVLNDDAILPCDMHNKTYFIAHSERDWRFILNLYEAYKIIVKERPAVLISAGAGLVVPFAMIAKIFNIKIIYIETWSSVKKPSLTGRIMYYFADFFYYQWRPLKKYFPKGQYLELFI